MTTNSFRAPDGWRLAPGEGNGMNRTRIREILLANGFRIPEGMTDLREYVYDAVEALLARAGAPEGWRLVPEHPTPEMLAALRIGSRRDAPSDELCEVRYRAMLATVPTPPVRPENTSQEHVRSTPEIEHEPVAWAATDETGKIVEALGMNQSRRFSDPLYLHPPALRLPEPMTDAEIMELYRAAPKGYLSRDGHAGIRFARAIEAETLRRVKETNE